MRIKVGYLKVCLGGNDYRYYKVLVGDEVENINGRLIVEDFNYQFKKFRFYFKGNQRYCRF